MTARFKFLTGDINWSDYGGKFWRRVAKGAGPTEGRFHVIEVINWNEHENDPEWTYHVELSEVDLDATSDKQLDDALRSCYGEADALSVEGDPNAAQIKVEALHGYGSRAPLWDRSGNNINKLMKEARAESARLDDPAAHEEAMNRPVNKLGSTAREYAQGDIYSAMTRGVSKGEASAKLMAKIHGASDDDIAAVEGTPIPVGVSFSVNLKKIPSNDPLAYSMGYMHALAGQGLKDNRNELADAYLEGYRLGTDVKAGRAKSPEWAGR